MDFSSLSLEANLAIFAVAAALIAIGGVAMTSLADRIADRTGLGEAMIGGALLGASTSLSGTVTSVSSAAIGHPSLAISNAIGGIAAQTAFLALADIAYRRANLEHAAASATNLIQATLLMVMLSLPIVALPLPSLELGGIHLISAILLGVYWFGLRLAAATHKAPMWEPSNTSETRWDLPEEDSARGPTTTRLATYFLALAVIVGAAGWMIAGAGIVISQKAGISETVVGALLTATATSLPELVTTMAAVRRGALQLAVGGIIGGNTFDVLFLVLSDIAYRPGSIYHAGGGNQVFWIAVSMVMTGVLLLGLLRRERHGFANIGFESALILLTYALAVAASVAFL